MNVRHLLIPITAVLISGCSSFGWKSVEPVTIQKKAVERQKLNLPEPTPLQPRSPKWIVVTPENVEQVWKQLKDKNVDLALFALTDDGYEELAINIAELRNFIHQQRVIIMQYKKYYETEEKKSEDKK